jgi:citrate lyase beta subunit
MVPAANVGTPPLAALRSWLFVPGDSERKQAKALATGADALILDLEDSVDAQQLPAARSRVRELLRSRPATAQPQLWARINPPAGQLWRDDLEALLGADAAGHTPDGIVVPKVSSPQEIAMLAERLAQLEARCGIRAGDTRLLVLATDGAGSCARGSGAACRAHVGCRGSGSRAWSARQARCEWRADVHIPAGALGVPLDGGGARRACD